MSGNSESNIINSLVNVQGNIVKSLDNVQENLINLNNLNTKTLLDAVNSLNKNEYITPLVFYSIPSVNNSKIELKLLNKGQRYYQYILEIPKSILVTPVTKRVHEYSPINKLYWKLLNSSNEFLHDVSMGFNTSGDNYDVDNIGGIVPGTYRKNGLAVCHLLYINDNKSYQINFYIKTIKSVNDSYIFELHTDKLSETYGNTSNHPSFENQFHFHASPVEAEIIIPEETIMLDTWALEMYQDAPLNASNDFWIRQYDRENNISIT